jgi:hypothetical protein
MPKVMFTGVVDENGQKIVKTLGGEMVESIYNCTHLVTDQVRRTVKFLCGLARGILIVSPDWLDRSKEAGKFVDGNKFVVRDEANERKYNFRLVRSIATAAEHRLFHGYKIHVTKSVKPDPNQMRDIIQCAGGQFLVGLPKKADDGLLVVTVEDDLSHCKVASAAGIPLVSSEFILTGLLHQTVDIDAFRLPMSPDDDKSAARGTKRRTLETAPVAEKARRK